MCAIDTSTSPLVVDLKNRKEGVWTEKVPKCPSFAFVLHACPLQASNALPLALICRRQCDHLQLREILLQVPAYHKWEEALSLDILVPIPSKTSFLAFLAHGGFLS